jgi:hypothetical protein
MVNNLRLKGIKKVIHGCNYNYFTKLKNYKYFDIIMFYP